MKQLNQIWLPALEEAIQTAMNRFASENAGDFLSDLYLYLDEEFTLHLYDDLERKLYAVPLEKSSDNHPSKLEKQLILTLRQVLQKLEEADFFTQDFIFKPFTVNLVDKNFMVTEELIFIDNDTLKIDGDLLAGLDDELNAFFRDLMEK